MELILTPVHNAFDRVKQMCDAIDNNSRNEFLHILIDDNSEKDLTEVIPVTKNRRILLIKSDFPGLEHKSGLGQAVQLGYDYAHQLFMNEIPVSNFDWTFLIESDVMVHEGWDEKQINLVSELPDDWASLDVQSVDEEGKLTYPTTSAPRIGYINPELEHMNYADFQCTLFNPAVLDIGVKFSDLRSHFDILWSRAITEKTGKQHYRTKKIEVTHYPYSSRNTLPGVHIG